jgi:hypothetical protein
MGMTSAQQHGVAWSGMEWHGGAAAVFILWELITHTHAIINHRLQGSSI